MDGNRSPPADSKSGAMTILSPQGERYVEPRRSGGSCTRHAHSIRTSSGKTGSAVALSEKWDRPDRPTPMNPVSVPLHSSTRGGEGGHSAVPESSKSIDCHTSDSPSPSIVKRWSHRSMLHSKERVMRPCRSGSG